MNAAQEQEFLTNFEEWLRVGRSSRDDLFKRSLIAKDFYRGRQFTQDEIDGYKSKGVTPVTINHCLPVINTISGLERQNRQDIKVFPLNGGTNSVAGILTELVNHAMGQSYGKFVVSDSFKEGIIASEDFLRVDVDKTDTPGGKIIVKRRSCGSVIPDPTATDYDLNEPGSGCRWLIDREWISKDVIRAEYPDKEEELRDAGKPAATDPLGVLMSYFYGDEYDDDDSTTNDPVDQESARTKSRFLKLIVWWKETVPALRWTDLRTQKTLLLTKKAEMAKARRTAEAIPDRFRAASTTKTTLHKTCMVDRIILSDEVNPFGEDLTIIPYVRFSPYWSDGYAFGLIDNIIGPQREENINRTQATRILNQTANSGWLVTKVTAAYKKILEKFGSVPGVVIEKELCGGEAERITPNPLSQGHVALGERSSIDIREISSVNDALQGYETGRAESGRALGLKQQQGRVATEPVMDNLRWTLRLLGDIVLKMVINMEVYTDDEIKAVVGESKLVDAKYMERAAAELKPMIEPMGIRAPRPPMPLNTAVAAQLPPQMQQTVVQVVEEAFKTNQSWEEVVRQHAIEMLLRELKNDSVRQYGVSVDTSPSAPTVQMANFLEMTEINNMYPGAIPPDVAIEASSLPNKENIIQRMKQNMQAMAMAQGSQQAQGAVA